jgi:hypothetical protein
LEYSFGCLNAVELWHPNVQQDQIWPKAFRQLDCLLAICCLTHDLKA